MSEIQYIIEKLELADGDLTVLTQTERDKLIELLDKFCEEIGITTSDELGGMDIYTN